MTGRDSKEPAVVIVTEPEFIRAESVFRSHPLVRCVAAPEDEDKLSAVIRQTGARYAIVGTTTYRDALYASLPSRGVIARFGVGCDGIDKAKSTRAGILCTNTPSVLNESVAEFTVSLILGAARHTATFTADMKNGIWPRRIGMEVRGKTLAVVGCGQVGRAVARIASEGLQMQVICANRTDDYRAAVGDADFVSLHISSTPDNIRFMNRERLAMLNRKAWLINTARGVMVDEAALYDALASSQIAGAALDVFEREPYEPVDRERDLRTLSNVILSPHAGSSTVEASARMAERALRNVLFAETGEFASMDLVNPEVLGTEGASPLNPA